MKDGEDNLMTTFLARRAANRKVEAMQQLVVFRIQQECFALPIQAACKVIPTGQIYGAPQEGGVSLTQYQNQEILVIDINYRIFRKPPTRSLPASTSASPHSQPSIATSQPHLLVVQNNQGELIGIPLDTLPMLRRVRQSAFTPLPPTFLAQGNIRCVCALVVCGKDEPPAFLLNLEQLLNAPFQLPDAETRQEAEDPKFLKTQVLQIPPSEAP